MCHRMGTLLHKNRIHFTLFKLIFFSGLGVPDDDLDISDNHEMLRQADIDNAVRKITK